MDSFEILLDIQAWSRQHMHTVSIPIILDLVKHKFTYFIRHPTSFAIGFFFFF